MRTTAAILAEYDQPLIVDEIELESPRSGEVLLRMLASGICRSDISLIKGYWPVPLPMVLGHEGAGVIEEVGPGVDPDRLGEHVVVTLFTSSVIQRYPRPAALELYGTEGSANLLGEDWDPSGFELWRNEAGCWNIFDATDPTWSWCDGLRELVESVQAGRQPLMCVEQDLHILEIANAARTAAREQRPAAVHSRFEPLDLST